MNQVAKVKRTPMRRPVKSERERQISLMVGQNIKTLRAMTGISQTALAEQLGLTFQQVQKYETGMNRVSAPKLVMMAEIFNTPITTFFSHIDVAANSNSKDLPSFSKQGLRAARLVDQMPPRLQGPAIRVLQSLATDEG